MNREWNRGSERLRLRLRRPVLEALEPVGVFGERIGLLY
jgi:hypothetical protein